MFKLNENAHFKSVPSIEGYLAAQCKRLVTNHGMKPDPNMAKARYHSLDHPTGCFAWFNTGTKENTRLRAKLSEFDSAFREFEAEFMLEISNIK
jgi:hypothetical protein